MSGHRRDKERFLRAATAIPCDVEVWHCRAGGFGYRVTCRAGCWVREPRGTFRGQRWRCYARSSNEVLVAWLAHERDAHGIATEGRWPWQRRDPAGQPS